jgi:hypothetical protein
VIDLKAPNFQPLDGLVSLMRASLARSSLFDQARSLTIVGTAFPSSMGAVKGPLQLVPREEWMLYKVLIACLPVGSRIPAFGDYAIAPPDLVQGDMRLLKPAATIRYTIEDA